MEMGSALGSVLLVGDVENKIRRCSAPPVTVEYPSLGKAPTAGRLSLEAFCGDSRSGV